MGEAVAVESDLSLPSKHHFFFAYLFSLPFYIRPTGLTPFCAAVMEFLSPFRRSCLPQHHVLHALKRPISGS